MKKKIFFRADASKNIGYGHFVRTLALARMLKDDFDCTFYTVTPTLYQKEEMRKVCNFVSLPQDSHFFMFLSFLKGDEIVVLDNYFFSTNYQKEIKDRGCYLVCIDDIHDKHYVADVVINHGVSDPGKFSIEPNTLLCLGYRWALLRTPFFRNRLFSKRSFTNKLNIVICFGGSDSHDLTSYFIQHLIKDKKVNSIAVIIGDKYNESFKINSPVVSYFQNLNAEEVAKIFDSYDLAILPTSTICIEALFCQIPIAAGYYVDNQIELYNEYSKNEMIYPLGNLRKFIFSESLLSDIEKKIPKVKIEDSVNLSQKYRLLFNNLFNVRDYKINDFCFKDYRNLDELGVREIWRIRNEKKIRCWMENQDKISWEDHLMFLSRLFHSYDKLYFGVYYMTNLIGSVNLRFDSSMCNVERGIFIAPQYLNRSLGSEVEKSLEDVFLQLGILVIKAKVLKTNSRSLNFHLKNGYSINDSDEKYDYLIKYLNR